MGEEKKNRTMHFITGISLGLVIGGSVVYFTQNTNIVKYPLEMSQKTIEGIVNKVIGTLSSKKDTLSSARPLFSFKYSKGNKMNALADTSISGAQADTLAGLNLTDTVNSNETVFDGDTTIKAPDYSGEEAITVRKDELEEIKYIETLTIEPKEENNDTAIARLAGIQVEKTRPKKFNLYVEFWRSPINYKGYKLAKNKLIVYGINPQEVIKLILLNDIYYMRYGDITVKLPSTNSFKSFEKVNNADILAAFN